MDQTREKVVFVTGAKRTYPNILTTFHAYDPATWKLLDSQYFNHGGTSTTGELVSVLEALRLAVQWNCEPTIFVSTRFCYDLFTGAIPIPDTLIDMFAQVQGLRVATNAAIMQLPEQQAYATHEAQP